MKNNDNSLVLDSPFEHNKLFYAYRNILYLGNNKCYTEDKMNRNITLFLERNNKNIEKIIYFSLLLKSRLRQKLLNETFRTINEINNEIDSNKISLELKIRLEEEKKSILNIYSNEVDETVSIIIEHCVFISSEIDYLNTQFILDELMPSIKEKERLINSLTQELISLDNICSETKKELDIIQKSEIILHEKGFLYLFTNSIPSKEIIENLDIEVNDKNILNTLINILSKLFSILDSGFSYTNIVDARHQLTDLYLKQIKEISRLKNKKQNILFELKHYYALTDIDHFLKIFINQMLLLNEYWLVIQQQLIELKENISLTEHFIIPLFLFLDNFSLYYGDNKKIMNDK
ncbi:alpha-xenorhabdolysin family binary toxin subunit B [Proteus mirabilis]|uniref:alpha-xenorhabdolysin family binary toxin subunit B n=1 Tax=Proteus TaxID=583 RepID=UPI0018C65F3C|nr:alpha-xenorhabdolysin family binary toxin subunit B [Proteus vulgaris]MBG3079958.1 alpha-xenorhabdolysin family binary toxin subunit B [Proteus mirabilis]QPN88432.1 alpha-xenorhabdolysin family binary toxin subunit B [Proteus vulgaris]